jgi:DNA-directed RNA polymerase subunit RPC12/RpoP
MKLLYNQPMERDYAESLLRSGIINAKAGEKDTARRYLERAVDTGGDYAVLSEAWYWLGKITDDPAKKRSAFENCLSFDLNHAPAHRELAILDGKLDASEIINPDAMPAASIGPEQATADRFMCPQCGAKMVFAPDGVSLVCEHCSSRQALSSQGEAEEKDFLIAMATARGHGKPVAMQVFHCQGCGAEFILPPDVISITCAYCDSPYVISLDSSRELLPPEGIIPQAFDQKQAAHLLASWVEQNGIKPQGIVDLPRGVYLPIWTFDVGGTIAYRGDRYEADESFGGRSQKVVHVDDEYPVYLNDLPVPASGKAARKLARLLPTFELHATRPYDPRYLANWAAEVYDVPMADASLDARSQAYTQLKSRLPGEIASLFNLKTSSAKLAIESFKLVLLPVWITEIPFHDQRFLVLINGQNGIVQGKVSPKPGAKPKNSLFDWLEDLLDD